MQRKRLVSLLLMSLLYCACAVEEDPVVGEESEAGGAHEARDSVEGGRVTLRELDDDSFDDVVKKSDFIIVEFYTPWCHHCANLVSLLEELATELGPKGVNFAKVNIEDNKRTKSRFEVTEVPHLRMFRKGVAFPYTGPSDDQGKQALTEYFLEEVAKPLDDGAMELTEANFDQILEATPIMLVEFYAEWCLQCQQLEPHFHAAANRLRRNNPPVLLGQVKIPDQLEVAKRYGVEGYPLLIVFRYGKQYNYTGPREEEGIVQYMRRQAGPASKRLISLGEAKSFSNSATETRAIAFFSSSTKTEVLERYQEAGNNLRNDLQLGHTTEEGVAKEMGFSVNTIVVFHPKNYVSQYESGYSVIKTLPAQEEVMVKQLLSHARSLVGEMTEDNQLTMYQDRPLLVAYLDLSWDLHAKTIRHWHNLIASVAKDHTSARKSLTFAVANEESFLTDLKLLGLSDWGEDVAVGIFAKDGVRYTMEDEELSTESLKDFVNSFLKKKLKPHLNSEPVPKSVKGSSNTMKKVVGDTFDHFMSDTSNNRLLKLCMPEVADCEKAKEYFPKVVARYEGANDVVFGEMNLALNDVPPTVKMDGEVPVFLFARKGSKDIMQVTPKPTDDADLIFFLKVRHSVRPTLTEKDIALRAKYRKNKGGKKDKKKRKDEL